VHPSLVRQWRSPEGAVQVVNIFSRNQLCRFAWLSALTRGFNQKDCLSAGMLETDIIHLHSVFSCPLQPIFG